MKLKLLFMLISGLLTATSCRCDPDDDSETPKEKKDPESKRINDSIAVNN